MITKKSIALFSILFLFAASCSKDVLRVTAAWYDEGKVKTREPAKSVFVMAITPNVIVRQYIEADVVAAAKKQGINAVRSIDVLGMATTFEQFPTEQAIVKKVKDLGLETIFTVTLIDEQSETRYVPGTVSYAPYPTYGYYGRFGGYYGHWNQQVYTEGYYETEKTYFLESNLYDTNTQELLLSIQSKATKLKDVEKASKNYTETLVDELHRKGLMKNKK